MKISLILVLSILFLTGCGSGGGGGSDDNSSGNSNSSNTSTIDTAEDTSGSQSDTSSTILPSFNDGSSSNNYTAQFENDYASEADHNFWGCVTTDVDNRIQVFLGRSNTDESLALISVNDDEIVEGAWTANATALTITPDNGYSPLVFSNYSFASASQWSSDISSGSYTDKSNCALYDQDGVLLGDAENEAVFSKESLLNELDDDGYFTSLWSCESDSDDPFRVVYGDDDEMAISVAGGGFSYFTWSIDTDTNTIFWIGKSVFEFSGVEMQSIDSHSGYFQGTTPYQCVREAL